MPQSAKRPTEILKGNEATVDAKNPRFQIVEPLRQLRDNVQYRKMGPGVVDPVANAENQLQFLRADFPKWLKGDLTELSAAWNALRTAPSSPERFIRFHKAVHVIAGNAAILDCPTAGKLAAPLARLLERRPAVDKHLALIQSTVAAIVSCVGHPDSEDDPRMTEIIEGLEKIVGRWISSHH